MTTLTRAELVVIFRRLADVIENEEPAEVPKPPIDLSTVVGVQQAFNLIRRPNYPHLEEDGVKGPVTTFALKELQATAGLPVTGEIDEATVELIRKNIPSL